MVSHLLILKIIFFSHKDFPLGYKHPHPLTPKSSKSPWSSEHSWRGQQKRQGCPLGSCHWNRDSWTTSSTIFVKNVVHISASSRTFGIRLCHILPCSHAPSLMLFFLPLKFTSGLLAMCGSLYQACFSPKSSHGGFCFII